MWPSKRQALEPTTTIPTIRLRVKLHLEADLQMMVRDSSRPTITVPNSDAYSYPARQTLSVAAVVSEVSIVSRAGCLLEVRQVSVESFARTTEP
jgi:hypothetical protein